MRLTICVTAALVLGGTSQAALAKPAAFQLNETTWTYVDHGTKVRESIDASGNYIYYGVREFGMGAIQNGIALHGGFIHYSATFLVFMEYMRNACRMAALMKQQAIYVYTHDSIGLGEDGPTHQPIEQIANLRGTPNMSVWRPCDTVESAVAWKAAIERRDDPRLSLDLAFRDETGASVTLRQLAAGKPMLFVPVIHGCPNICAITLADLAQAIGLQHYRLGPDFNLVAFGIDPREGPADAADSLAQLQRAVPGLDRAGLHALTGTPAAIATITGQLGYRYSWDDGIKQYAHVAAIAVLTPDGRLTRWLYGLAPTPAQLDAALAQASAGKSGGIMQQILLLCFHYDPSTGRYTLAITKALRLAGIATVLLIALALFFLSRRRRTA